jgi:hypothetical protein
LISFCGRLNAFATSRNADFLRKRLIVDTIATLSNPCRWKTNCTTSSRRREQKSVSKSGGVARAGFRKRSKNRSRRIGSGDVISRQYATTEDAAEPREENGTPLWRAN